MKRQKQSVTINRIEFRDVPPPPRPDPNDPRIVPYFNHSYGCGIGAISPALLFVLLLLMARLMRWI